MTPSHGAAILARLALLVVLTPTQPNLHHVQSNLVHDHAIEIHYVLVLRSGEYTRTNYCGTVEDALQSLNRPPITPPGDVLGLWRLDGANQVRLRFATIDADELPPDERFMWLRDDGR